MVAILFNDRACPVSTVTTRTRAVATSSASTKQQARSEVFVLTSRITRLSSQVKSRTGGRAAHRAVPKESRGYGGLREVSDRLGRAGT